MNNRDFHKNPNNRDNDFCHNGAALQLPQVSTGEGGVQPEQCWTKQPLTLTFIPMVHYLINLLLERAYFLGCGRKPEYQERTLRTQGEDVISILKDQPRIETCAATEDYMVEESFLTTFGPLAYQFIIS